MKAQSRLQKLETAAISVLPPDGTALNRKSMRLTDAERKHWLKRRTIEELDAMIRVEGGEPLDLEQFTDAELERIAAMSDEEIARLTKGDFTQLRPTGTIENSMETPLN